jgi:signal transduction histidine kinase
VRVRTYGLAVIAAVAIAPITIAGMLMVARARSTALDQVRVANARVADRAAKELGAFVHAQAEILRTVGNAVSPAAALSPQQSERVLRAYVLAFPHLRSIDVVGKGCQPLGSSRLASEKRPGCGDPAVDSALAGRSFFGSVRLDAELAPIMLMAVPLDVAGVAIGAAVAEVDMVGMWDVVNGIQVARTGRARLIASDGTLLGHGDPQQRGRVFQRDHDATLASVRAVAPDRGVMLADSRGRDVLSVWAEVPELGWTVVVEQPVSEAYAAAQAMARHLWWIVGATVVLAIGVGLWLGGPLVRGLEAVRGAVVRLGRGEWTARAPSAGPDELRALADALNHMAGELDRLHAEARARERLDTFARVAAGLAHDLRLPIENAREAVGYALSNVESPELKQILHRTLEADLSRLSRFVRDLRRLAHDGDVSVAQTSVDPGKVAARVIEDARAAPRWGGVEFSSGGSAQAALLDADLMERAIGNLVANAADATVGRAGGQVTVTVRDEGGSGGVAFDVSDNGPGMSTERIAAITDGAFQSDKRASGIGLGLVVVRHVARVHGGTLAVKSTPGQGTTFTLKVNRGAGARTAQADPGAKADPPAARALGG